jgi:large subunit ribosomal protein L16
MAKNFKKIHRDFFQKNPIFFLKKKKPLKTFKLISKSFGLLTKEQIESARRSITRTTKRVGKVYIKVDFNFPRTFKAKDSRMGKGKGKIKCWISYVYPGKVILEVFGVSSLIAKTALISASKKLTIDSKIC